MDNENTHSTEHHISQINTVPLGQRFRTAREKANLSIEDVAVHLRLTCQLVQDIENEDYSRARRHLVFLRGYLRAYSKLVELPADEVIAAFNSMSIKDIPIHKPSWQTEEAQELERAERSNWLAFMVLSTLLVAGVITWWYAQHYGFSSLSHYLSENTKTYSAKKAPIKQAEAIKPSVVEKKVQKQAELEPDVLTAKQISEEAIVQEASSVAQELAQVETLQSKKKSVDKVVIEAKETGGTAVIEAVKDTEQAVNNSVDITTDAIQAKTETDSSISQPQVAEIQAVTTEKKIDSIVVKPAEAIQKTIADSLIQDTTEKSAAVVHKATKATKAKKVVRKKHNARYRMSGLVPVKKHRIAKRKAVHKRHVKVKVAKHTKKAKRHLKHQVAKRSKKVNQGEWLASELSQLAEESGSAHASHKNHNSKAL